MLVRPESRADYSVLIYPFSLSEAPNGARTFYIMKQVYHVKVQLAQLRKEKERYVVH